MKKIIFYSLFLLILSCNAQNKNNMNNNPELTQTEKNVVFGKGTERPFTGKYDNFYKEGTYHCKVCDAPLYRSSDKFDAGCGWPAFDDEIEGAVERITDADGKRTEIICKKCKAHLGHVFEGEHLTDKDTRHCVNSISLRFKPTLKDDKGDELKSIVLASGCFWGTEYWFSKLDGVVSTRVGYAGGWLQNPSYEEVSTGQTGHVETVEVIYNPKLVSEEKIIETYFNTHDPEQIDGQGPDKGAQYLSAIFYTTPKQKQVSEFYIEKLKKLGYKPATKLEPLDIFYPEQQDYHYKYYEKKGGTPYCHIYKDKFN